MSDIEHFLHGQLACWNARDREGFLAHYRQAAPNGLEIEYVGSPPTDAWQVLEDMWAQQNERIRIEVASCIVNANEAACHHRNLMREGDGCIETIETYRFGDGRLAIRYFVARPG